MQASTSSNTEPHSHALLTGGRLGFWLSLACAVHCVAMPVLFLVAPALSARFEGLEWLEWGAAALAFILTLTQLWPEYLVHRRMTALVLATAGLSLLLAGMVSELQGHGSWLHSSAMVIGSLLMAAAFYTGHRLRYHAGR